MLLRHRRRVAQPAQDRGSSRQAPRSAGQRRVAGAARIVGGRTAWRRAAGPARGAANTLGDPVDPIPEGAGCFTGIDRVPAVREAEGVHGPDPMARSGRTGIAARMAEPCGSRSSGMSASSWRPGGSVLCDPWFTPAYFGSWFPFPATTGSTRRGSPRPTTSTSRICTATTSIRTGSRATSTSARQVLLPEFGVAVPRTGAAVDRVRRTSCATRARRAGRPRRPRGDDPRVDGARRRPARRLARSCSTTARRGCSTRTTPVPAIPTRCGRSARSTRSSLQFSGAIWYPIVYDFPPTS